MLKKLGIDTTALKVESKQQFTNLMLFGNFNPRKFLQSQESNEISNPSKFDLMKRRLRVWRYEQIYKAYNFYKSEET